MTTVGKLIHILKKARKYAGYIGKKIYHRDIILPIDIAGIKDVLQERDIQDLIIVSHYYMIQMKKNDNVATLIKMLLEVIDVTRFFEYLCIIKTNKIRYKPKEPRYTLDLINVEIFNMLIDNYGDIVANTPNLAFYICEFIIIYTSVPFRKLICRLLEILPDYRYIAGQDTILLRLLYRCDIDIISTLISADHTIYSRFYECYNYIRNSNGRVTALALFNVDCAMYSSYMNYGRNNLIPLFDNVIMTMWRSRYTHKAIRNCDGMLSLFPWIYDDINMDRVSKYIPINYITDFAIGHIMGNNKSPHSAKLCFAKYHYMIDKFPKIIIKIIDNLCNGVYNDGIEEKYVVYCHDNAIILYDYNLDGPGNVYHYGEIELELIARKLSSISGVDSNVIYNKLQKKYQNIDISYIDKYDCDIQLDVEYIVKLMSEYREKFFAKSISLLGYYRDNIVAKYILPRVTLSESIRENMISDDIERREYVITNYRESFIRLFVRCKPIYHIFGNI